MKRILSKIPFSQTLYARYKHKKNMQAFKEEYNQFAASSKNSTKRFELNWENRFPCLGEKNATTSFDAHYVYHTSWAARVLAQTIPTLHTDISSSLFFASITSAFIPIDFYDYRPANLELSNLNCKSADLAQLPFSDNSIPSLSCMHVVEHIGLGRYGDTIDYNGDITAIQELKRVLAPLGNLLFVVPIGKTAKIIFNAHRIYTAQQVIDYFSEFTLKQFSLVTDTNKFVENAKIDLANKQQYGCGCFWFRKNE